MAQRTRARGVPLPEDAESESKLVSLVVSTQVGEETFTYYANHAEIACIPHEFAILFARMPTKLPPEKIEEATNGTVILTCDVQILIPTTMIDGLIMALDHPEGDLRTTIWDHP